MTELVADGVAMHHTVETASKTALDLLAATAVPRLRRRSVATAGRRLPNIHEGGVGAWPSSTDPIAQNLVKL